MKLKPSPDVQMIDVHALAPWEENPRTITRERLDALKRALAAAPSMLRARPLIALVGVDYAPDGAVIGGNQRQVAALELVEEASEAFLAEFPGGLVPTYIVSMPKAEAMQWALRDNNPFGRWEDEALARMMSDLRDLEADLELTGFEELDLSNMFDNLGDDLSPPAPVNGDAPPPGELPPDQRGSSLMLSDVSIGDPIHAVENGDMWRLGPHILVCASVYVGWPVWAPLLESDPGEATKLFVPYPTPTVPLTIRAKKHPLVLVQPDPWLAGHVVDKYASVEGEAAVSKLDAVIAA